MSHMLRSTPPPTGLVIDPRQHAEALGFEYRHGILHIDGVDCLALAQQFGTPAYVYSQTALTQAYRNYQQSFASLSCRICYAVKANSNLHLLKILADLGAGFDIVSKGELLRVLQVTDGKKVVFSGIGKSVDDIKRALLADIACFNVESWAELDLINDVAAALGKTARIALRINPDVDAKTHPYIATGLKDNKFGIDSSQALACYRYAQRLAHVQIVGVACHIGSQLLQLPPFTEALDKLAALIGELKSYGMILQHVDIGGGLGVRYIDEHAPSVTDYADTLLPQLRALGLTVYLEPGRSLVANAGVLLMGVDVLKTTPHNNFAVLDASMSELLRPALYGANMAVIPCQLKPASAKRAKTWQLVGAVCESADVLGRDRCLDLATGDVLALTGAGAYGFAMASNYNSRPKPCEILLHDGTSRLISRRERFDELWRLEQC